MSIRSINGQEVRHTTITEMVGQLHAVLTLEDGDTRVEIILAHCKEKETRHAADDAGPLYR